MPLLYLPKCLMKFFSSCVFLVGILCIMVNVNEDKTKEKANSALAWSITDQRSGLS